MWRKLPWYVKLSEAINVYGPPSPTNQYVDDVKKVDIVSQIKWSYKCLRPPSPTNQYVDDVKKVAMVCQIKWSYKCLRPPSWPLNSTQGNPPPHEPHQRNPGRDTSQPANASPAQHARSKAHTPLWQQHPAAAPTCPLQNADVQLVLYLK